MNWSVLKHPALARYMSAVRSLHPPSADKDMQHWYRIEDQAGDEVTVYIYDEISYWGITAEDFARAIAGLDVSTIHLHVNSPGGLVFDGIAIHNTLRDHKATVLVTVDGVAASIASVIAMAGDTVTMGRGTRMMVHNPHGLAIGEAKDMRQYADLLDNAAEDIAGFYAERTGGEPADWRSAMDATTWYSAQQAVDAGLADKVTGTDDTGAEDNQRSTLVAEAVPASAPSINTNRSRLVRARDRARRGGVIK